MRTPSPFGQYEELPGLDPQKVQRIELLVRIKTTDPHPDGGEPTLLIDRYLLQVLIHEGGTTRAYALRHALVELCRTRRCGRTYIAWDEADQVLEDGKSPLNLIRNEILDHRLLPRDPHYQTKLMATVFDALDRVRAATGLADLACYQLWFVRPGQSWTEHPLDGAALERTREAARAIGFEPPGCVAVYIAGIDAMGE